MYDIFPVSSETTIASASVFSVIPTAALCLNPNLFGICISLLIGKTTLVAFIVLLDIIDYF